MNDDPTQVDVLYVKVVNDENKLSDMCNYIIDTFVKAQLCLPQENNLKLHATLINTKLRNTPDKSRQAFDATPILQAFGEIDLGLHRLSSIQLSQRGAFDDNNYWKSVVTVSLP